MEFLAEHDDAGPVCGGYYAKSRGGDERSVRKAAVDRRLTILTHRAADRFRAYLREEMAHVISAVLDGRDPAQAVAVLKPDLDELYREVWRDSAADYGRWVGQHFTRTVKERVQRDGPVDEPRDENGQWTRAFGVDRGWIKPDGSALRLKPGHIHDDVARKEGFKGAAATKLDVDAGWIRYTTDSRGTMLHVEVSADPGALRRAADLIRDHEDKDSFAIRVSDLSEAADRNGHFDNARDAQRFVRSGGKWRPVEKYSPDQPRDDQGQWAEAGALSGHLQHVPDSIGRAVGASPGRATHGHTAKNAFFITSAGEAVPYNEYARVAGEQGLVTVHSHSADSRPGDSGEEDFQPLNSMDVHSFLKAAGPGGARWAAGAKLSGDAVIMRDGRLEVLATRPDTDPKVFRLGTKALEGQLHRPYAERKEYFDQHPDAKPYEQERELLRAFAAKYRLDYHEGLSWRGETSPTAKAENDDTLGAPIDQWLRGNAGKRITGITETSRKLVAGEIAAGEAAGETIPEIARRLEQFYLEDVIPNRAMVIARTEVGSAANWAGNFSAVGAAAQADVGMDKEWLSLRDGRTRGTDDGDEFDHVEADGQRVGLEEPFVVSGERMMYPMDPTLGASAGNIINCRCTCLYHVLYDKMKYAKGNTARREYSAEDVSRADPWEEASARPRSRDGGPSGRAVLPMQPGARNVSGQPNDPSQGGGLPRKVPVTVEKYSPDQPRDDQGQWAEGGGSRTAQAEVRFKPAAPSVDGREVDESGPTAADYDAVRASLYEWDELDGVREVPMDAFEHRGKPRYRSPEERDRTLSLAREIEESGRITPLIVVYDGESSPYVLEGAHRFDALRELGAKSMPAVVIVDKEGEAKASEKKVARTGYAVKARRV
jgi:hypothetical protein